MVLQVREASLQLYQNFIHILLLVLQKVLYLYIWSKLNLLNYDLGFTFYIDIWRWFTKCVIKREYDKFNIIDNPILKKHDATKSELQTELDLQNELRWQFYNAYIENHGKLVNFTTEEEWDKVIKSVNRIF